MRFACLLGLLLVPVVVSRAAPQVLASGENRAHLIELFTSEGCSSCPPAEDWLNGLRGAPGLWREFVPVAFHVDYWDRLGWSDRLATREFTDRQYAYAAAWRADTVYTPGFVLNGRDWRERGPRRPPRAGSPVGVLKVEVAASHVRVTFEPAVASGEGYEVHAALLAGGIISPVKAGENRGETLAHEFAARALVTQTLVAGRGEFDLPAPVMTGMKRRALACWVTRPGSLEPVQATGGWLE